MNCGNRIGYLRVSLLTGCNLRCAYCRPEGDTTAHGYDPGRTRLFKESIDLLLGMGVKKVRFTGGEPTLYRDLAELIAFTRSLDNTVHVGITSNGTLLDKLAPKLAEAGLGGVNISLDTINRDTFKAITSTDALETVISGIKAAVDHIGNVKLNCVLQRGVNDTETRAIVEFANELGVNIRFIEFMPSRSRSCGRGRYISGEETKKSLGFRFTAVEANKSSAARYYSSPDLDILVGFINPVSHPFCTECDRLRLASTGRLYGCLFSSQSVNLFDLLSGDRETAMRTVQQLVDSKQYLGCAGAAESPEQLPSFIEMGG